MSTTTALILVNGSPTDEFKLSVDLDQRSSIPFSLFLITIEGLSILMNRAMELVFLEGAKIGRNFICISHLQFADDTIFIGAASIANA